MGETDHNQLAAINTSIEELQQDYRRFNRGLYLFIPVEAERLQRELQESDDPANEHAIQLELRELEIQREALRQGINTIKSRLRNLRQQREYIAWEDLIQRCEQDVEGNVFLQIEIRQLIERLGRRERNTVKRAKGYFEKRLQTLRSYLERLRRVRDQLGGKASCTAWIRGTDAVIAMTDKPAQAAAVRELYAEFKQRLSQLRDAQRGKGRSRPTPEKVQEIATIVLCRDRLNPFRIVPRPQGRPRSDPWRRMPVLTGLDQQQQIATLGKQLKVIANRRNKLLARDNLTAAEEQELDELGLRRYELQKAQSQLQAEYLHNLYRENETQLIQTTEQIRAVRNELDKLRKKARRRVGGVLPPSDADRFQEFLSTQQTLRTTLDNLLDEATFQNLDGRRKLLQSRIQQSNTTPLQEQELAEHTALVEGLLEILGRYKNQVKRRSNQALAL